MKSSRSPCTSTGRTMLTLNGTRGMCSRLKIWIDRGYTVIRFGLMDDWDGIIAKYPNVFGRQA